MRTIRQKDFACSSWSAEQGCAGALDAMQMSSGDISQRFKNCVTSRTLYARRKIQDTYT